MQLDGKTLVVTGAGGGIGRELVAQLLSKGARVAGVDLNAAGLVETAAFAGGDDAHFAAFPLDITDGPAVSQLPALIGSRLGPADGIINNAGIIQPFQRLEALVDRTVDRVIAVNLLGTLAMVRAFLPSLRLRPEAQIVNLSGMGGFVPVPGQTIYCAAKAGVKMLTEGLASELRGTSVHLLLVLPGAIATRIAENSGARPAAPSPAPPGGSTLKAMPPRQAATQIIRAIEQGRSRLVIGSDARLMDKLYRLSPGFAAARIADKMKGLLS